MSIQEKQAMPYLLSFVVFLGSGFRLQVVQHFD